MGKEGPSHEVIAEVVQMKQRNPAWGCPRIAQQIALAFDDSATTERMPPGLVSRANVTRR